MMNGKNGMVGRREVYVQYVGKGNGFVCGVGMREGGGVYRLILSHPEHIRRYEEAIARGLIVRVDDLNAAEAPGIEKIVPAEEATVVAEEVTAETAAEAATTKSRKKAQ